VRGQAEAKLTDLHGQTYGLKARQLHRLRGLYKRRVPRDRLVSQEFARRICEVSREIGRQVGTLVNRRGEVEFVTVGDAFRIELPDFKRVRGGGGRLRGLRCIHTHLHGESLTRDDLTDLKLLRLDAMVAVRVDDGGLPTVAEYASLRPADGSGDPVETHEPLPPARIDFEFLDWVEALEAELARSQGARELGQKDRAVLVGVRIGRDPRAEERLERPEWRSWTSSRRDVPFPTRAT
jgi:GTP-binding protein HflX